MLLSSAIYTHELGYPAVVASNTYSLFAPPNTPPAIVAKLNQLVQTALRDPDIQASFAREAAIPAGNTPERFIAMIQDEGKRWLPIIAAAGMQAK